METGDDDPGKVDESRARDEFLSPNENSIDELSKLSSKFSNPNLPNCTPHALIPIINNLIKGLCTYYYYYNNLILRKEEEKDCTSHVYTHDVQNRFWSVLSGNQYRAVLYFVLERGAATSLEIYKVTRIPRPTITRALNAWEKIGLIGKVPNLVSHSNIEGGRKAAVYYAHCPDHVGYVHEARQRYQKITKELQEHEITKRVEFHRQEKKTRIQKEKVHAKKTSEIVEQICDIVDLDEKSLTVINEALTSLGISDPETRKRVRDSYIDLSIKMRGGS